MFSQLVGDSIIFIVFILIPIIFVILIFIIKRRSLLLLQSSAASLQQQSGAARHCGRSRFNGNPQLFVNTGKHFYFISRWINFLFPA